MDAQDHLTSILDCVFETAQVDRPSAAGALGKVRERLVSHSHRLARADDRSPITHFLHAAALRSFGPQCATQCCSRGDGGNFARESRPVPVGLGGSHDVPVLNLATPAEHHCGELGKVDQAYVPQSRLI